MDQGSTSTIQQPPDAIKLWAGDVPSYAPLDVEVVTRQKELPIVCASPLPYQILAHKHSLQVSNWQVKSDNGTNGNWWPVQLNGVSSRSTTLSAFSILTFCDRIGILTLAEHMLIKSASPSYGGCCPCSSLRTLSLRRVTSSPCHRHINACNNSVTYVV